LLVTERKKFWLSEEYHYVAYIELRSIRVSTNSILCFELTFLFQILTETFYQTPANEREAVAFKKGLKFVFVLQMKNLKHKFYTSTSEERMKWVQLMADLKKQVEQTHKSRLSRSKIISANIFSSTFLSGAESKKFNLDLLERVKNLSSSSGRNTIDTIPSSQQISKENSPQNTSSSSPSRDSTLGEVLSIYQDVLQLEKELFQPQMEIQTLLPQISTKLTPQEHKELKGRINELKKKLEEIQVCHYEVMALIKSEKISAQLAQSIEGGKQPINHLKSWIQATYPKAKVKHDPAAQTPRKLIADLLKWYIELDSVWRRILNNKVENQK